MHPAMHPAIIWILGVICAFFLLLIINAIAFPKEHPEHMPNVIEEQAKYEMHTTIEPGTTVITAENVQDIINCTIIDGEHPALTLRKSQGC